MDINSKSVAPLLENHRRGRLVTEATLGMTYEGYLAGQQTQAAVERHFEVIGEAFRRLHGEDEPTAGRIVGHRAFIGLRNVIAHGYDRLVQEKIWEAITVDLPPTIIEVELVLKELGELD